MPGAPLDPEILHAAQRARECPYPHSPDHYARLFSGVVWGTIELDDIVDDTKPETYGELSLVIDDMVEPMLADERIKGPIITAEAIERVGAKYEHAAEADVPFIAWIYASHGILAEYARSATAAMDVTQRQSLNTLLRLRQSISDKKTVYDFLLQGGSTALITGSLLAHAMNEQLKAAVPDKAARLRQLRRSHQPLLDCTELYVGQLVSFVGTNLGATVDDKSGVQINLSRSRTDLFTRSRTNRQVFKTPPEQLQSHQMTHRQPLVRCPIRLSPRMTERFWLSMIDSMDANGLL